MQSVISTFFFMSFSRAFTDLFSDWDIATALIWKSKTRGFQEHVARFLSTVIARLFALKGFHCDACFLAWRNFSKVNRVKLTEAFAWFISLQLWFLSWWIAWNDLHIPFVNCRRFMHANIHCTRPDFEFCLLPWNRKLLLQNVQKRLAYLMILSQNW